MRPANRSQNPGPYPGSPRRSTRRRRSAWPLVVLSLFLLAALGFLAFIGVQQQLALNRLQADIKALEGILEEAEEARENSLREQERLERENETLERRYQEIREENETLRDENLMMRSSTIIQHGDRETNKVAITIDDGAGAELMNRTLDYLAAHDVRATLFPMGSWVEREPEAWRRAVAEGHELGNHTYSHAFLSTVSEERVREELNGWQESVNEALGLEYRTLFFRPPGMDGFTSTGSSTTQYLQEIIAGKGMFTILWDVELVYALRNDAYTTARVTDHVLSNATGGSIVLLHFTEVDIAALPAILSGLRSRGLEPCSLKELLLEGAEI